MLIFFTQNVIVDAIFLHFFVFCSILKRICYKTTNEQQSKTVLLHIVKVNIIN